MFEKYNTYSFVEQFSEQYLNCTILHQEYRNEIIPLNSHSFRIRIYLLMRVTKKPLALMSRLTLIGK